MTKSELLELLKDVPDHAEIEIDRDGITYEIDPIMIEKDTKHNRVVTGDR